MITETLEIEPGQPWTVERFRPEDAVGVTALFHSVYGDKYPVHTYLDPELLTQENREGRVISSVARIPSGQIVGHTSLFNSAPCPRIFENGAGLVHHAYRGGHGILTQMVAHGFEMGRQNPLVELIHGEPVCNHIFTQKLGIKLGMLSQAMEVSLMPAKAYVKEGSANGRVSTLLTFLTLKSKPCTVYVPQAYEKQFAFCYEGLDDQRTFEISCSSPEQEESLISIQTFEFANVARIAVAEPNRDFAARILSEEKSFVQNGIRVIQVWLNTGIPWSGWAADLLRSQGYFFGGVMPRWFDTDGMLMQKVLDEPDWEGTVLVSERNQKLAELVKKEWEYARE